MTRHITDDIKAVFFDHDDTLVDTIGTKWKQHQFVAKKYYGITLQESEIRKHWGNPLEELMRILYKTDDLKQAMEYTLTHHEEFPKGLYPETIPTIKRLHKAGKIIGIVAATVRVNFEQT